MVNYYSAVLVGLLLVWEAVLGDVLQKMTHQYDTTEIMTNSPKNKSLITLYRMKKFRTLNQEENKNKYKPRKKPVLELVEDLWTSGSSYSRLKKSTRKSNTSLTGRNDIPLQCLDVRALLIKSTEPPTSSTPASSLDLEWEHEHLPTTLQDSLLSSWTMVPEEDRTMQSSEASPLSKAPMDAADSDWSRVPSADSLEWDPVQSPLHCSPDLDIDTQQLLTEIEQLTERALRETGSGLTS